jgi:glycosyltransferase involved in cell wall biosynthesis
MMISIVIRTLNEAKYLGELLQGIAAQHVNGFQVETVVIDSGSTDGTLAIAQQHGCTITHIKREEFSFGRSLNLGCEVAKGNILVFVSGHCVPASSIWLQTLCEPIAQGKVVYSYGKQIGGPQTHFSEARVFAKYFPSQSMVPQQGFFCNNANSALARSAWAQHRFDEEVTGLEDLELAQRLHRAGERIGYVAEAAVYHHHTETWPQVHRRFEREALALQKIMPQVHVGIWDTVRYITTSIWRDWHRAKQQGIWAAKAHEIVLYRYHQYMGSFNGNHQHRKLSQAEKDKYFYPH